jgi:hypothetical protein
LSKARTKLDLLVRFPEKIGWRDHVVGALIGVAYTIWLLATARSLGFPRDEGVYFNAGSAYARWFNLLLENPHLAVQQSAVDAAWQANNPEHPSLMKTLFGLSWLYLHEKWKLIDDASTAFRLPGMLTAALALYVTYLFGARAFSRRAGVVGAVLLGAMPRVFFNAHLACFDVPIMAMWTACVYVYWRSEQEGGLLWALACGVMYGLTLETKHNAWILPGVFLAHAAVVHGPRMVRELPSGKIRIPANLVAMATIGPALFYALWPRIWFDTIPRLQWYADYHLQHAYYNIEFLHKNYFAPGPWTYAPVMIFATVPSITLLLFLIGAFDRGKVAYERARAAVMRVMKKAEVRAERAARSPTGEKRDRAQTDLLMFLAFAAPIAVFFLPKTPIFGGTKHWLPAYPFLAMVAGRGFDLVAAAMGRALATVPRLSGVRERRAAFTALSVAVVGAPLAETSHSHPFGLSAYVPIVGGTAGGADLGLNRQFWGFTTQSLAPYLEKAPRSASVFLCDTTWDSWAHMQAERRLRPDLRGVGSPQDAEFQLVHHELHFNEVEFGLWTVDQTAVPDYVLTQDGVPIISVYRQKR